MQHLKATEEAEVTWDWRHVAIYERRNVSLKKSLPSVYCVENGTCSCYAQDAYVTIDKTTSSSLTTKIRNVLEVFQKL